MKIKVMPRLECFAAAHGWGREYGEGVEDITKPTLIISISSMDTPIPNILEEDEKENDAIIHVEFCQFDDVDGYNSFNIFEDDPNCLPFNLTPMEDKDAKQILNAVEKYKDSVEEIIVHCDAGFSRSPAVAVALSLWLNGDDSEFFDRNHYCPNTWVYRKLLNEMIARHYF